MSGAFYAKLRPPSNPNGQFLNVLRPNRLTNIVGMRRTGNSGVGNRRKLNRSADRYRRSGIPDVEQFRKDLEPLREVCRWTDGYWEFGPGIQRKWNEIQNAPKDIQMLANYLLVQYKSRVWNKATDRERAGK